MAYRESNSYDKSPTIAVVVGVSMVAFFLTVLWIAARPKMAYFYGLIRSVEFPFVWDVVPSSDGFKLGYLLRGYVPPIESIFVHSMYYGIVFVALIVVMMLFALIRLEKYSIAPHMKVASASGVTTDQTMSMYADTIPYVEFYQRFDLLNLSTIEGDARQPMTAMEVLEEAGCVVGIDEDYSSGRLPRLIIDEAPLKDWLVARVGPENPFMAFDKPRLTRADDIGDAIDSLPWTTILILYPALWRRHSFLVEEITAQDADGFKAAKRDIDDFIERVWREMNTLCDEYGSRLHLGFDNSEHRAILNSLFIEKNGGKKRRKRKPEDESEGVISFGEMLEERGPKTTVVGEARAGLKRILTAHLCQDTERFPVRVGDDGRMQFAPRAESPTEVAYMTRAERKLKEAAAKISSETIFAHNYIYGLVGSALENARETGVMQPHLFNWIRFYDKPLWYFVHNLGMPTAVPENAASFEHYQAERAAKTAISEPFMRNCMTGLATEANKYLVEEERDRLRSKYGGKSVKTTVKSMFDDLLADVEKKGEENSSNTVSSGMSSHVADVGRSVMVANPLGKNDVDDANDDEAAQSTLGRAKKGLGSFF